MEELRENDFAMDIKQKNISLYKAYRIFLYKFTMEKNVS